MTDASFDRYSRQIVLPGFGREGQARLAQSRVLLVGAGALGSASAFYLAAAGIGSLTLVDPDAVEVSNLHRQILHTQDSVGQPKAESGAQTLRRLNPALSIRALPLALDETNAGELCREVDLVVDGTDNLSARFATAKAARQAGKPWIYAAIHRFHGELAVFTPEGRPCYRCLNAELPESAELPACRQVGVLGATAGVIGSMQALEAVRLLLGEPSPWEGRLGTWDLWTGESRAFAIATREDCPWCGGDGQDGATQA